MAGVARAGANSRRHLYKQKVQKMADLPKTCVLSEKQIDYFRRKKRTETLFSTFQKKPSGIQGTRTCQLNKTLVNKKKEN